jgi:ethanolamine ammonia-lyase large subunit
MASDLKSLVILHYQERIAERQDIPNELRRALKTHERVPTFIENLHKEFLLMRKVSKEQIRDATRSLTDVFIAAVRAKCEQRDLSALEIRRINEEYAMKRLGEAAAEALVRKQKSEIDRHLEVVK